MKIAIDLNDVVRDFTYNFLMYYVKGYNHQYDPDNFNESTNESSFMRITHLNYSENALPAQRN